jgi:hypothetical protein
MKNSVNILAQASNPAKEKGKAKKSSPAPMGVPSSDRESMSIRKIENGYIVRHSCDGKDGYSETEYYTEKKPVMTVPKGK